MLAQSLNNKNKAENKPFQLAGTFLRTLKMGKLHAKKLFPKNP
jgi:hypothetical protein